MAGRADPLSELRALLREREPLYAEADITIDTTHLSTDEVVNEAVRRLGEWESYSKIPARMTKLALLAVLAAVPSRAAPHNKSSQSSCSPFRTFSARRSSPATPWLQTGNGSLCTYRFSEPKRSGFTRRRNSRSLHSDNQRNSGSRSGVVAGRPSLAFVSNRHRGFRLYVADEKGANARLLVRQENEAKPPRWSPEGASIAFLSRAEGTGWDLWLTPADGSADPKPITMPSTTRKIHGGHPTARGSPSARRGRHRSRRLGIVNVQNGEVLEPLPEDWQGDSFGARWSPDGKRIAFVSDEPGHKSIYLLPAQGVPERLLTTIRDDRSGVQSGR